ncbi:hypothetical protein [Haloplanus rubicundus]|uniref:Uncharacterized protein n=1 Tax=Haloplanus rubicundus TaxID=1547898 RepID=A0A345EB52_9EURY|nr:hypothetical protein [Haloplanus rubicundus]AXG09424.1 hypothetical protein DU484_05815 [Haloplanus rubicundus]
MLPTTRRALLGSVCALAGTAGCLGNPGGSESTPTQVGTPTRTPTGTPTRTPTETVTDDACTAAAPPRPSDAAAAPKPYPEKPDELTRDSVSSFVEAYERAYQYNEMLAAYPDMIGRRNDLDISVNEVTVTVADGEFTVDVTGQANTGITADGDEAATATPTRTPLPMGHWPFEATYTVTDRFVRRAGVVHECWGSAETKP